MRFPEIYFGSPDGQMLPFLNEREFRRGLVLSVLFQGDLVIPDVFFFDSPYLRRFILHERRSPFSTWVKSGMIVPAFRDSGDKSFMQCFERITASNIVGVPEEAADIAKLLDKACLLSREARTVYWPKERFDLGYKTVTTQAMMGELAVDDPRLIELWARTENLRIECFNDALANSPDSGLRRGELYKSIARYYKLSETAADDIRQLMDGASGPEDHADLRYILKWTNYCYHYNQGKMLGLMPSLQSLDALDVSFSRQLNRSGVNSDPCNEAIEQSFDFYSLDHLLSVPAGKLVEVRNSDKGVLYFSALQTYQANPNDETGGQLRERLTQYADSIRLTVVTSGASVVNPDLLLTLILPTNPASNPAAILTRELAEFFLGKIADYTLLRSVSKYTTMFLRIAPKSAVRTLLRPLGRSEVIKTSITQDQMRLINGTSETIRSDVSYRDS